jgi:ribonuclease-3 family protein
MEQHNGLSLAYVGDAVLELFVRHHLIAKGFTKVGDLHKHAIKYTSAIGQAKVAFRLQDGLLSEEEMSVFKRGRNATSNRKPKNTELSTYHQSTGLEALIGYLYLQNNQIRLDEIFQQFVKVIEELS